MCEVGNVPNWILVGDSPNIQNTIVTAGLHLSSFFGTRWLGEVQGLSERRVVPMRGIFSNSDLAIRMRSGASRRGREAAGGPGVVYSRVSGFPGDVCEADYFWEVQKRGVVA